MPKTWVGPIRKPRKPSVQDKKAADVLPSTSSLKSVDFVMVYRRSKVDGKSFSQIETFLSNLEEKGFELESTTFSVNPEINFIKIHAPEKILLHFAEIFGIELAFQNAAFRVRATKPYKFMATELTDPTYLSPLFQRARDTLSGVHPKSITNAEKSLIIYKVLSKNPFGVEKHEFGIEKLINQNVFECVYPLHDGPHKWTEEGPLNDRQLLKRYWSNIKYWYKQQPLDLIERYFGPETSFYFAWLGFYNKMLIPASVTGFVFFLVGLVSFNESFSLRSKEVCESDILLCPRCIVKNCKYEPLKNACFHANLIYLVDNPLVIAFAGLMSIWSTIFLELWHREEAMLQIRWNLRAIQVDCSTRPEFEEKATHFKVSEVTGVVEPYMSKKVLCYRYTITFTVILLLVILVALGIFGVMIYVKTMSVILTKRAPKEGVKINVGLIASVTGSLISVTFILTFDFFYEKIALWLTNMENPRTQVDFDNSFTYKCYAMAFVNNYSVIFYIAFMKARLYTYPGDRELWTRLGGIWSDLCHPSGCIIELGIQLIIVLMAKNLVMTARQYIIPKLLVILKTILSKKVKKMNLTLQWESDYVLNTVTKYHVMGEYMQMIIQYGFVTFFVAAFPPAPLLALFNNLIELRVDALKLTTAYQRPVAFKIPNLAAWNGILQGVTYIGVATNAFVIAFTSDFVQRAVYQHSIRYDLHGFVNSTLSAYNVSEFPVTFESDKNVTECYYPGKRYPPDHPRRYELTDDYWYYLMIKFLAVVIFEHMVIFVTGVVAYVIPDIPFSVKQHINYQRDQLKVMKLKLLREAYLKEQKQRSGDIF